MKPSMRARLFNLIADAWNRGEAPWAYVQGRSEAVDVWEAQHMLSYAVTEDDAKACASADRAVLQWVLAHGLHVPTSIRNAA